MTLKQRKVSKLKKIKAYILECHGAAVVVRRKVHYVNTVNKKMYI